MWKGGGLVPVPRGPKGIHPRPYAINPFICQGRQDV